MNYSLYAIGMPGLPELMLLGLILVLPMIVVGIVVAVILANKKSSSPNPQNAYNPTDITTAVPPDVASKKLAAGLCGILIPALGVHKFILGYTNTGLIMLLVSLFTCGFGAVVFGIIGFIEGIMYLTKSDEEFYRLYFLSKKEWF